ncbi:hypothetical protein NQ317_006714 [Molorchus minor]|uniref:Transaldolase n=1 Tax=Molorchus minor TaxID=1323400 RepID=A0ABQ9K0U5_9CUCU|nr:hypothetical protein NQ317_006714 [Molorchus minor]
MSEPQSKKSKMSNSLEQLKALTTVVADTGDFEAMKKYAPTDATTNPSLDFTGSKFAQYKPLIDKAVQYGNKIGTTEEERLENAMDMLGVLFGVEILKIIPGRVSTEVDARLSFDKEASIAKSFKNYSTVCRSRHLKERILLGLASTWKEFKLPKFWNRHIPYTVPINMID